MEYAQGQRLGKEVPRLKPPVPPPVLRLLLLFPPNMLPVRAGGKSGGEGLWCWIAHAWISDYDRGGRWRVTVPAVMLLAASMAIATVRPGESSC
jgi:hypothetical protein